jgi:excisionase family DNA binding protein
MSVEECAEILRVSTQTLRRWVATHRIPHLRVGRTVRFDPTDVRRWIEARKE